MRVLGWRVQEGVSKQGEGEPYQMGVVCLSLAVEQMKTKNTTVRGKGRQGADLPLDAAAIPGFEKINFPVEGLELDLVLDQKLFFGELKTVCVGIRGAAVKAA